MGNNCCADNSQGDKEFTETGGDTAQASSDAAISGQVQPIEVKPTLSNQENENPNAREAIKNEPTIEKPVDAPAKEPTDPAFVEEPPNSAVDAANPVVEAQEQPPVPLVQQMWDNYTKEPPNMCDTEKQFLSDVVTSAPRRPSTLNTSLEKYVGQHAAVFDQLRSLEGSDGWNLKKSVGGVDIYTKNVPGEDMLYTKGVTKIKTYGNGIRHLVAHLLMAEDRPKYDEMCSTGATIEGYLPYYRIISFKLISPAAIIAPRDVVTLSRITFEKDGSLLVATESVDHPLVPEKAPYVRCLLSGGYTIRPTSDPDEYQVIFAVRTDPKGWLPGWVKSLIAWKVQLALVAFKKFYSETFGKDPK